MGETCKGRLREFLGWVVALQRSMEQAVVNESPSNVWKHIGYKQFARKYQQIVTLIAQELPLPPIIDGYNVDKMGDTMETLAVYQKTVFEGVHANVSILRSFLETKIGVVEDKIAALRDFFQARLRSAILRPPEAERDVQDAVETLLIGRGLQKGQDYDREVGRVKFSAKEVVPDFILLKLSLAVEVKLIRAAGRIRDVVDEINADIAAYSKRYASLIFIVYDLGFVRDEVEFRHDLEDQGNIAVLLVKQ